LAGSGIRAIRLAKELPNQIKKIYINDSSKKAVNLIQKNLQLNKIPKRLIQLTNQDANLFILNSKGFDYIDIDPFGTPNPFLDSAMRRLSRNSILAITATDTSALCGTYPKSCKRKYWANHAKNPVMHELGLRILIRKTQLVAAQYDKALTPIFSYSKDHYMRVFFKCEKSKELTNKILNQHDYYQTFGPLWTGPLWDKKLAKSIAINKFLKTIAEEAQNSAWPFYDIHALCKKYKLTAPNHEILMKKAKARPTHFSPVGLRTKLSEKELIKKLNQ